MRVTKKKFIEIVNSLLKSVDINDFESYEIEQTYYTANQIECGAFRLLVKLKRTDNVEMLCPLYFGCYFTLGQYSRLINEGYELFIRDDSRRKLSLLSIEDITIDFRKK